MSTLLSSGRGNFLSRREGEKVRMTKQKFKQWLATADANGDGIISRKELRIALKSLGLGHAWLKARGAVNKADLNDNNAIDSDLEVMILTNYAATHWGIIVSDDE